MSKLAACPNQLQLVIHFDLYFWQSQLMEACGLSLIMIYSG